ncbi:MAG TPA: hypothetical protein VMT82_05700, partial [candidate division Zixibacteria bacterium]|nr:hypothetical protein [candidate division Zixibacteria bacterium]
EVFMLLCCVAAGAAAAVVSRTIGGSRSQQLLSALFPAFGNFVILVAEVLWVFVNAGTVYAPMLWHSLGHLIGGVLLPAIVLTLGAAPFLLRHDAITESPQLQG